MPTIKNASIRLLKLKEKIINEWEAKVRAIATSTHLARPQLLNSLPKVLDILATTLADPHPKEALFTKEKQLAVSHGKIRAKVANYSLEQVINEYHILRQVIFEVLEENGEELTHTERDLIWDVLFISIKNAAAEFKQVRDGQKDEVEQKLNEENTGLKGTLGKKQSESAIKDHLLKTIFERVEDYAIFTLDPNGNITSWGTGCEKIKQFTAEDVMGKNYSLLYPKEGRLRNEPQQHLEIARSEGRFRGEGLRQRKYGELFLADVFITPMYDNHQLVGFLKIVYDLTEKNKLLQERDLSRMKVETLEIENDLRDRFIFMLTHDLRNPIQATKLSSEMITRQTCDVPKHLDLARRSILHIGRVDKMVSDLLDASQIREGTPFPLKIEECDLVKVVYEVDDELASLYGDRFDIDAPAALIGFWDSKSLRRAIENLVTNAIKYGAPEGRITIHLRNVEDRVFIKIHNFGLTISKEDQESLFDLFHRTASAKKGEVKGWGLGLTLVKGITEAHQGIVKVRSLAKEGTTFILDIPRDARPSHLSQYLSEV